MPGVGPQFGPTLYGLRFLDRGSRSVRPTVRSKKIRSTVRPNPARSAFDQPGLCGCGDGGAAEARGRRRSRRLLLRALLLDGAAPPPAALLVLCHTEHSSSYGSRRPAHCFVTFLRACKRWLHTVPLDGSRSSAVVRGSAGLVQQKPGVQLGETPAVRDLSLLVFVFSKDGWGGVEGSSGG